MSLAQALLKYKQKNQRRKYELAGPLDKVEPIELSSNVGGVGLSYNDTLNTQYKAPQGLDTSYTNNASTMGTVGNYAGLAGSLIGSMTGYEPTEVDSTYNTIMSGVSAVGPVGAVIGGASQLGHAIGDPIREGAESYNEDTGYLDDAESAVAGGVVGSFLDPLYSSMSIWDSEYSDSGDKWGALAGLILPGISGKIYGENLMEEEQDRVRKVNERRKQEIFDDNYDFFKTKQYNQSAYGNTYQLKYGGKMSYSNGGNIKKDVPGTPLNITSNSVDYYGPSHNQGGIPLGKNTEVETGEMKHDDYVFSDKIPYNG
jgi:hypothetical protein